MTTLRTAAQQALAFTMRDFASLRDFEAARAVLHDNLRAALAQPNPAQRVVDEQAEDEGLWFRAQTAAEAYLQQALRRLHAAVEGEK